MTSSDHQNYGFNNMGMNNKKSPGDLRRLAVTQTPVENHQLMLVWKKSQKSKMIITVMVLRCGHGMIYKKTKKIRKTKRLDTQ